MINSFLRSLSCVVVLVFAFQSSFANHIFGADFYYQHVSGNTYKVSLAIYGDCEAANDPNSPFNGLVNASPQVTLLNGNSQIPGQPAFNLILEGPGVDVTPVCAREQLNTKCNGGTIDGVTRFIYSRTVTINTISANLKFRFAGQLGNTQAGRSNQITNLSQSGSSIMQLDAELNNTNGSNSSPTFTTIPTPFYCINVPQQYNQGAVDPDNDSLDYLLTAPAQPGGFAAYLPPFTASNPLSSVPGTFVFNPATGQLDFTPDVTQKSLVVTKVVEYRNGVKIGSASRELTFVVIANCAANTPPTGVSDTSSGSLTGAKIGGPNTFNICEGAGNVNFSINPKDADNDSIEVSVAGLPFGATANILNNNTPTPKINFFWNATGIAPGNYNFFVTYKDKGCPISASQTQAYVISVIRPIQFTSRIISPTECAHKAKLEYNLSYGQLPRNVVIRQGNNIVHSFADNTGQYIDSLEAGNYTFTISSPKLSCVTTVNVMVKDSGIYPYPPEAPDAFFCLNDASRVLSATAAPNGNVFWFDSLGARLPGPPLPNTAVAGIFRYGATQIVKVCESKVDTVLVYVTERPIADFVIDPSPVCARDTATINFTGTIGVGPILEYKFTWSNNLTPVSGSGPGPYRFTWYNPGIYTVRLQVFENKCPSDSVEKEIRVKPKPRAAFFMPPGICLYDSVTVRYTNVDSLSGEKYAWDFGGATLAQSTSKGPFRIHWDAPGIKKVGLTINLEGCSDTISHTTEVFLPPTATISNTPGTLCLGDKVILAYADAGPGITYTWLPKDEVRKDKLGNTYVQVIRPANYRLAIEDVRGCVDTANVRYNKVEPCCQFIFPNAFTPNSDGRNDKFRIKLYGNQEYYDLSIYNRWGERLYHSADPAEGWDGRFNEKDCETGVYFYKLHAKCLTGYEELKQGDFTLIR